MSVDSQDTPLPDWATPKPKGAPQSQVKADLLAATKKYAFIIGSSLIIFASLRNSLTWHFESFWGASKTLWQDCWRYIYVDTFRENHFLINVVGTTIMSFVHFWLASLFFMVLDIFEPKMFMKYKIQDDKRLKMPQLYKAIRVCLFNQLVVGTTFGLFWYHVTEWRGVGYTPEELPTFQWVLLEGVVFTLVEEFAFYYTHRLLHHPRIYKYIHKKHHEWTASISIVGIYAHPVEHVLSNLLPVMLGPTLMGSHVATYWVWVVVAQSSTLNSHCGYHLPFFPSPEAHDFHHMKFTNNFGVLGVLDRLHGTDSMFVKTKAYDRHILMIGLQPVKELFPDEKKKYQRSESPAS